MPLIDKFKNGSGDIAKKVEEVAAAAKKKVEAAEVEGDRVISAVKARAMKAAAEAKAKAKAEPQAEPVAKVEEAPKEVDAKFKLDVDGVFGPLSITSLQHLLGTAEDGILGPETITALQKKVGAEADGVWGPNTSKALQKFLGVAEDGIAGKETYTALQNWINKELGF